MSKRHPDCSGKRERRFNWLRFRMMWGRWCYQTDYRGMTTAEWWEWEKI